jgi:glycosyltransferase involved in cell wall biosynthesis
MTEAMACGTPVVAWRNGAAAEVVADGLTGFVVDSVDGMVAAVGRAGEIDPAVCRAHVEGRFSVAAMVDAYEQAYAHVVDSA